MRMSIQVEKTTLNFITQMVYLLINANTECFMDLGKLIKFADGGLILA
jgi:hypothetical protein